MTASGGRGLHRPTYAFPPMSLPPEFFEKLGQRGDAELYDILAHSGDYLPEALEAIRRELARRNLPPAQGVCLQEEATARKSAEAAVASRSVGWPVRIAVLVGAVPLFLIFLILLMHYRRTGQKQKIRECGRWFAAGVLLWPVGLYAAFVLSDRIMRKKLTAENVINGVLIGAGIAVALLVLSFLREFYFGPRDGGGGRQEG